MAKRFSKEALNKLEKPELIEMVNSAHQRIDELEKLHFGKKSERHMEHDDSQLGLFDEAEIIVKESPEEPEALKSSSKEKPGRKSFPKHLPRTTVRHELSIEERTCADCNHVREEISTEITEELEVIPAKSTVIEHVHVNYGPCACHTKKQVISVPRRKRLIPGSQFSHETIAQFMTAKFVDGLPFYRQEAITERAGYRVSRQTMAHLLIKASSKLSTLLDLMIGDVNHSPVLRMDETTIQVLKEHGRKAESKSYVWVNYAYKDHRPIIIYRYNPSRSGETARRLIDNYQGFLQTDGYGVYDSIGKEKGITHIGCWAHIRREFKKAYETSKGTDELANEMLGLIKKLYDIESQLREQLVSGTLTIDEFNETRRRRAGIVLSRIELWLDEHEKHVTPKSSLGSAILYMRGQFEKAARYTSHELLTPDNNPIERAIRPFVMGRKNWLFSDTMMGAHASMTMYSLIITAKENGLLPNEYLKLIFDALPYAETEQDLRALLPYEVAKNKGLTPTGYFSLGES